MSSLYEINIALSVLLDEMHEQAEENNGEISDELSARLDSMELNVSDKIENTVLYIKNLTAESTMIKAEEKNLSDRRKVLEAKSKRVSDYLKMNLHGDTFKSAKCSITYRKREAVEILDAEAVPVAFVVEKVSYSADKIAIKKAIKAGEPVSGAELVSRMNMVIK